MLLTRTVSGGSDCVSIKDIIVRSADRGKNDLDISSRVGEHVLNSWTRSVLRIFVPDIIWMAFLRNDVQSTILDPWWGVPMNTIPIVDERMSP